LPKAASKLQLVPPSDRNSKEAVIDEFGQLDREVAAFKPTLDRHKLLKEKILSWFPELPGDQAASVSGLLYDANISPRENERRILDMASVYKNVGKARFLEICKLTLKALEGTMGVEQAAAFFVSERTGPRKVTAIPKAPPRAVAA
jgi:hypothetical protein